MLLFGAALSSKSAKHKHHGIYTIISIFHDHMLTIDTHGKAGNNHGSKNHEKQLSEAEIDQSELSNHSSLFHDLRSTEDSKLNKIRDFITSMMNDNSLKVITELNKLIMLKFRRQNDEKSQN